jgi:putative nucleotidyltransferase with HDIG domain
LYSRTQPVRAVSAAVAYIGMADAKRVILAASARPLFSSVALRDLWQHSVDVAAIAEHLAGRTAQADPSEAFVAGLIHDIGRLAIEMAVDNDFVLAHKRLAGASGSSVWADLLLTGQDHGEIGATVLKTWKLPDALATAIRFHHCPERSQSALPSIVYLAETVAHSNEIMPCPGRLEHALRTSGVHDLDTARSDLRRLGTALAMVG